ncbi:MAG: pantetheine-phosphate adenylyltransferase, partial [Eubacteriales bacterium]|nr:pantetheine-phosphate adenylyltransferase [Eubacteriales bacterium]
SSDRKRMVELSVRDLENVQVSEWQGLFAEFCRKENITVCLRGLRTSTELEAEKQMARLNRELYSDLDTIFLTTSSAYDSISSSAVRELAAYGVKLDPYVPAAICNEVERRYARQ